MASADASRAEMSSRSMAPLLGSGDALTERRVERMRRDVAEILNCMIAVYVGNLRVKYSFRI